MAVPVQTPFVEYIANGVTTNFSLGFDCENQSHLIVTVDDIEPIVGSWSLSVGAVVFNSAPISGSKIIIKRNSPFERDRDFQLYDQSFRPPAVNLDLDRIWRKLQELGVMDWLLSNRIDDLKNYVDDRDDELRAYLLEEIRKQGVALDQLEDYYNYLMQRLAEIAVNQGWDASFVVDGNETQKVINDKSIRVFDSITDLMAYTPRGNGQTVNVKSYYIGENKGGDKFYYDSTKSLINNGVTIFNGWLRDLSDKILTTDDAGLKGDGSDTNVTTRLQAIADAVSDGFTIEFIGNYKVSTSIYFNAKKSLKLSSINGKVEGDKATWSWGAQINGTNRRGIFVFKDCPDLDITRLNVKGIQKNIFGSFQDGDSCIQLLQCFNPKIKLCTLTNSFAWPIIAEGCEFPVVEYNVIADVVHQSGINICVGGGKNAKVNFNHITNCGLYGIEFETYTALNDDTFEAFGNVISDCYAGITPTGSGVTRGAIIGNSIYRSGYAAIMMQNIPNAENISVFNNPLDENYRGAIFNNSPNVKFIGNPITGKARSDIYLKLNPDWFVLKVLDSNNFLIHPDAVTATGDIYIGGVTYTVTAIASQADPSLEFELPTLRKVTVSQTITDALVLNKHTQRKVLTNGLTEANITMLNASNGLLVKDNTLSGGQYCIYYDQGSAPTGNPKQYVYDNEMLDFGINAILHTKSTNHVYYRGNKTKSTAIATYNIHADLIKNGSFATKSLKMVDCATQTASVKPVNRFGAHNAELIVGIYTGFFGGTTTGSAAISLNSNSAVLTTDGVGAPLSGRMFIMNAVLQKGINSIEFVDTVGDLAFTSAYADLLVPA
ncbi:hypothetical protein ACPC5Q_09035 [Acinetobacter junii]|uniref:hypothetical protein n=1 Tax=Acinetobacter junii TaxID=40215 RepID=UPI003C1945B3